MNKSLYKVIIITALISSISAKTIDECEGFEIKNDTYVSMYQYDDKENNSKEKLQNTKTNWSLKSLYSSDDKWASDLSKFEKDMKEIENYIGKSTKTNTHLNFSLEIKESLDIKLEKLCGYVKLRQDTNKRNYKYLDMNERLKLVIIRYNKICSDLDLEILKLSDNKIKDIMNDDKISSKYKLYINDIVRNKKHYLDEKREKMLTDTANISYLPGHIYELFMNMDKKASMNTSDYKAIMEGDDREERKLAYKNELITYNDNINTLSGLLIGQIKKNQFYATQRNYESVMDMYLEGENIDKKIYNNLIDTVNKNLDSLHKYTKLKKEILGLDKICSYDMSVPIVKNVEDNINYEKAQSIVYSSLSPLGREYADGLYKAFNERWIDVYPSENKVGGAYCVSIYDTHPYVLINYNNTLDSVSTIAHELGHGMYEYLSSKHQNFYNSNPSIFTHEVASVTNEVLLYENLIKCSKNDEEKAYYITEYLELIKNTLYMQTMYAEFERDIHKAVESSDIMNTLVLNDIWGDLLCKYYGKDYELDQLSNIGWARIPHFYRSFYVYKYATGCSAGVSFAKDISVNGAENYIKFLKSGSSKYPVETLKEAGVDLTSTKPIEDTIDRFDELLSELEKLTKNKK